MTKQDLRIVFFGTPDFAVESLKSIVDNGFNVVGVVTATDKAAGRGRRVSYSPVKEFALQHNLNVLQPENLKDEAFVNELRGLDADLFVIIAFRMLPEIVWSMPRLGSFNLHASLLPNYRGAAPINRAIMAGETKTGVTTFFLQHEIDTGDVIDRVEVDILPDDDAGTLHDRLMGIGAELTLRTLDAILDGTLRTVPQDRLIAEGAESCPAPKIFKDTCRIDWDGEVRRIHDHIRGLSPYPTAWSTLVSDVSAPAQVKIFKTTIAAARSASHTPGSVTVEGDRLFVDCRDGVLEILELRSPGRKRMTTDAFLRGARLVNPRFVTEQ